MKCKLLITIILFLVLINVALAEQSIEQNNFKITSDKETYYCEPITNKDGCLIKGYITIENNNLANINLNFGMDFSNEVLVKTHIDTVNEKTNKYEDKQQYLINSKVPYKIPFEFYAKESGKFNYYLDTGLIKVTLDPFYNVSYNASAPSYHLINGSVNLDNDDQFQQKIDITTGLSDDSDATTYDIQYSISELKIQNFSDGNAESYDFLASEGDAFEVEYIIDLNLINGSVEFCAMVGGDGLTPLANVSINGTLLPINIPLPDDTTPTADVCVDIPKSYLSDGIQRIGVGCAECTPKRIYMGSDETLPNNKSYLYQSGIGYTLNENVDFICSISYGINNLTYGKAIKPKFNLTIDENNDYWLRTRKTTTGLANVTLYTYQDDDLNINTSNYKDYIVTTGWDNIPINDIVYNGMEAIFRMYSQSSHFFSEIQLIEEIEDTTPANITDCQVNDSSLTCSDSVRLSCRVTEDTGIDKVYFNWTDNATHLEEVDKIIDTETYFKDLSYSHYTSGTENYLFNIGIAINLVNFTSVSLLNETFDYECTTPTTTTTTPTTTTTTTTTTPLESITTENDIFQLGQCPLNSTQNVLIFAFFVLISIILMLIAVYLKNGFIGTLGAILLLALSFYLWFCLWIVGVILSACSVMIIVYMVFNGIKAFK